MSNVPTALPTGLPDGHDDPTSPWFVEPEMREAYLANPPTLADYLHAKDTVILPPPSAGPDLNRTSPMGRHLPVSYSEADMSVLETYGTDEFKAHHAALERVRAAHARQLEEARVAAQAAAETLCLVCGAPGVAIERRVVDLPALRGYRPLGVDVQCCDPCALTLAGELLNRYAVDRLPNGSTRLAAARQYLNRLDHA